MTRRQGLSAEKSAVAVKDLALPAELFGAIRQAIDDGHTAESLAAHVTKIARVIEREKVVERRRQEVQRRVKANREESST